MRTVGIVAFGLLVCASAIGTAQQAPVFRGGVSLISVDVTALDCDGKPVAGLTAEDFEVKLDGHVQPVRAVAYEDVTRPAAAAARAVGAAPVREVTNAVRPPDPRLFVVLLDDLSIPPSRGKGMFFAATRFVDRLLPTDVVGMTTSSGVFNVNPTKDCAAVNAALRRTAGAFIDSRSTPVAGAALGPGVPMSVTVGLTEALEIVWGNGAVLENVVRRDCFGGAVPTPAQRQGQCPEAVERQARMVGGIARGQATQQLHAYLSVINAMRPVPGLKTLVIISDGIGVAEREQRASFDDIAKAAAAAGVELNVLLQEPDLVSVQDRSAIDANVRRDDNFALATGIQTVADLTGGNYFRVVGTPDPFFERVALASSAVYHLGVEAPAGSNPGRDFALVARVKRPAVVVHANRHAIAPVPVVAISTDDQLHAAVAKGALQYGVPLSLASALRQGSAPGRLDLGSNVEIPASVPGPITVAFGLVDAAGTLTTGQQVMKAPAGGGSYRLSFSLPVAPGDYRLRFAVADAAGHVGSVDTAVAARLPRLGPFATSDVLTSWIGDDNAQRFLALEEVPAGAIALGAALELYPTDAAAAPADVQVQWALVGEQGNVVDQHQVVASKGSNRLVAGARFPLAAVAPGEYEVRATVMVDGKAVGTIATPVRKAPPSGLQTALLGRMRPAR